MRKCVPYSILLATSLLCATVANAQNKVLAELFTNTNCGNCRVPEEAFEGFVNSHPQFGVVRIVYHNEITNNDDVFYVASKPDVDAREQMYALNANPLAIIDGFPLGNNESIWETAVQQAAAQALPVAIEITSAAGTGNKYNIHVTLTGSLTKQARLFVALTEDNIIYNNTLAYGNPTSGEWDDIFRMMLPSSNGTDPFQLTGTRSFDVTADLTDQDWNPSNMHVVAFVQDVATSGPSSFQAEGFAKQSLTTAGVEESKTSGFGIRPTAKGLIMSLPIGAHSLSLTVTDVLGRSIRKMSIPNIAAGEFDVDDLTLPHGSYIVSCQADGSSLGSCKIIR
jgi:hypothetical protein